MQAGTPGADNPRTVTVPETSPTRSHSRCWGWRSGLGVQWQTSAHIKTQLQQTAPDVVSASCAVQHHASTNLCWPPCRVFRENFWYSKTPLQKCFKTKTLTNNCVRYGYSTKMNSISSISSPLLEKMMPFSWQTSILSICLIFCFSNVQVTHWTMIGFQTCDVTKSWHLHTVNSDLRCAQNELWIQKKWQFLVTNSAHTPFCKGEMSKWS